MLVVASAVTWAAGARVAREVDDLAERTGTRRSLVGAVVLGGITSLPEAATVTTAAAFGGGSFAVGNVLGSVSANLAILAGADLAVLRNPLLDDTDADVVQRQAGLLLVLLALTTSAVVSGEPWDIPVGVWTVAIVAAALVSFLLLRRDDRESEAATPRPGQGREGQHPMARLVLLAALILLAGYAAARAGTAVAEQTGLSGSFVGFALLAVSTSLPEMSTTVSAVRLGRPTLAFSNVLGTNIFNHLLLLLADIAGGRGALFASIEDSAAVAAAVGVVLVGVYVARLAGPSRTRQRRAGVESVLVLALYVAGAVLVFAVGK